MAPSTVNSDNLHASIAIILLLALLVFIIVFIIIRGCYREFNASRSTTRKMSTFSHSYNIELASLPKDKSPVRIAPEAPSPRSGSLVACHNPPNYPPLPQPPKGIIKNWTNKSPSSSSDHRSIGFITHDSIRHPNIISHTPRHPSLQHPQPITNIKPFAQAYSWNRNSGRDSYSGDHSTSSGGLESSPRFSGYQHKTQPQEEQHGRLFRIHEPEHSQPSISDGFLRQELHPTVDTNTTSRMSYQQPGVASTSNLVGVTPPPSQKPRSLIPRSVSQLSTPLPIDQEGKEARGVTLREIAPPSIRIV